MNKKWVLMVLLGGMMVEQYQFDDEESGIQSFIENVEISCGKLTELDVELTVFTQDDLYIELVEL